MILFVDDEVRRTEAYRECCEDRGYKVRALSSVDDAWAFIEQKPQEIDLVILDVMLPTGDRYAQAAEALGGVRTGLSFYRDLRQKYPELPLMILTQSNDREIDATIAADPQAKLYRKQGVLPTDLPGLIEKQIKTGGRY